MSNNIWDVQKSRFRFDCSRCEFWPLSLWSGDDGFKRMRMMDTSDRSEAVIWPIKACLQPTYSLRHMPDQSNTEHACALLLNGPFGIVQLVLVFNCRRLTRDLSLYVYMYVPVRKEAKSICMWNWTTSAYSPYKQRALVLDHMLPFREKNGLLPLHVSHPNLWHLFFIRAFSPCSTSLFSRVDLFSVFSSPCFLISKSPLKSTSDPSVSPPSPLSVSGLWLC